MGYKFDFQALEMVHDLIKKVINGEHKEDDIQKDLVMAKQGLDMIVEELIKNKMNSITKEQKS